MEEGRRSRNCEFDRLDCILGGPLATDHRGMEARSINLGDDMEKPELKQFGLASYPLT